MRKVTVLTADIVGSRTVRWSGSELAATLAALSEAKETLVSPFTISRGDEIQGVVDGWLACPEIIRHLRFAARPLTLRIGIGIGYIEEQAVGPNPWDMSGEPFFNAREALDECKKIKGAVTRVVSHEREKDVLTDCILELIDALEENWSDKQWQAVQAYEAHGTFESAASVLGIRRQNAQKSTKKASWNQIRRAERVLAAMYQPGVTLLRVQDAKSPSWR